MLAALDVSADDRKQILEGLDLEKHSAGLKKNQVELEAEIYEKLEGARLYYNSLETLNEQKKAIITLLEGAEQELKQWEGKHIWSHEEFQQQQKQIFEQESKLQTAVANQESFVKKKAELQGLQQDVQDLQNHMMLLNDQRGEKQTILHKSR